MSSYFIDAYFALQRILMKPLLFQIGHGYYDAYGPLLFMDHDVVLVTLNYRLNTFGFFSLGNKEAPGNQGYWDQVLALKWVGPGWVYHGPFFVHYLISTKTSCHEMLCLKSY